MELIYNNESDLSEEHTQFLISSSKSLGDFSIEYSNTDLSEKNIIENEKNNSGVDYIFSSLFIGIPIAIAAITGAISGKAISRSGCCINCVANNIDSIIENYIFTNADYTFINQPYSNTDTIHI